MTSERRLRIDGEVIPYLLKRSLRRKKTVGIKVTLAGVEVTAPTRTAIREIEEILRKRKGWILEKMGAASQSSPPRRLETGESLPLMGRDLLLIIEESTVGHPSATSDGKTLSVRVPSGISDDERGEQAKAALVHWYRVELQTYLLKSVPRWLPSFGRTEMPRVLVREQRSRWGSCSSDGTLRFSWRLAMLEPDLIDSVVVHELAHLQVMNHSPAFWAVVLSAMPDAKERRKRLNDAGRSLPL